MVDSENKDGHERSPTRIDATQQVHVNAHANIFLSFLTKEGVAAWKKEGEGRGEEERALKKLLQWIQDRGAQW